jgi:hypothetical protein
VTGVHLHAAVGWIQRWWLGPDAVVGEVLLEPAEQRAGQW